jgi:glycosyltransferase involved in cell wall biosynthesis
MEYSMSISVVTVVYNGANTIEETIRSVQSQDYAQVEHIVVDGASTDNTAEIVKRNRGKIAVFVSEPDRGIYDAMNKGLALATGDVVGFLNADDVYVDATVLSQVAQVFRDATVDGCYADLMYVDKTDTDRMVRYWKSRSYEDGLFERGWMPAHPTFFVRRAIFRRLGGFDLDYRLQSDFELTMRFLAVNRIRTVYIPTVWVRMRMGGESNKRIMNVIRGNLEAYRACRKHRLDVSPFFIVKKVLSRVPQFFRRPNWRTTRG